MTPTNTVSTSALQVIGDMKQKAILCLYRCKNIQKRIKNPLKRNKTCDINKKTFKNVEYKMLLTNNMPVNAYA